MGSKMSKKDLFFLGVKLFIFWVFSILRQFSVSGSQLHGVCVGRIGTSAQAVHPFLCHFCYVGGFSDLRDPVLPTLRGAVEDFVTAYVF